MKKNLLVFSLLLMGYRAAKECSGFCLFCTEEGECSSCYKSAFHEGNCVGSSADIPENCWAGGAGGCDQCYPSYYLSPEGKCLTIDGDSPQKTSTEPLSLPEGPASNSNHYPCFLGFYHPGIKKVACGICLYSYANAENWTCSIPLVSQDGIQNATPNSKCIQGGIKSPETQYQNLSGH